MSDVLLIIETLSMGVLLCWAWRKSPWMSRVRKNATQTPFMDVLAVALLGAGAVEHGAYNVLAWAAPQWLSTQFGQMDQVFLVALYAGIALWLGLPILRERAHIIASKVRKART